MEPMRPDMRRALLERPVVTTEDISEYQQLQAQRFRVDPDLPMSPRQEREKLRRDQRLGELYTKLFTPR
jgi:hypothetical protein